ncbi:MAG: SpoIIE family protein phosphatase [Leptospirales bacterium]|nr:SpoIIE family protein phosphatase [Leptospirales bacterium]
MNSGWSYRRGFQTDWLLNQGQESWIPFNYPRLFSKEDNIPEGSITLRTAIPQHIVNLALQGQALALDPGWLGDVSTFYWNGQRFAQIGSEQPYEPGYLRHRILDIPAGLARRDGPNELFVVIYGNGAFPLSSETTMFLGPAAEVSARLYKHEILAFMFIAVYMAVGLYHLLLFAVRRQERHNLYFGFFCFFLSAYWFHRNFSRDLLYGAEVLWRWKLELICVYPLGPTLLLFLTNFFEKRDGRLARAYLYACGVLAALTAAAPSFQWASRVLSVWHVLALPVVSYFIYLILRHALRGNRDALYMLLSFVLLVASVLNDIAVAQGLIGTPHTGGFAFMFVVVAIAAVLATRFMRVHREAEDLNRNLEGRVRERTEQLQKSLEEVQALKVQQDGDYFLTSLLIGPLGGNRTQSQTVATEILVRQKKTFQFRQWRSEIGGDLCVAQSIRLRGRLYTVFLNADAMGKSIQGAGGALVLGTVFKAVLTRTEVVAAAQDRFPEQWLRDCFSELQRVFVSFDGYMMVSAIIGLVDDATGFVYFVNAEHPWLTLYRNGRASFIEDELLLLRKFGITAMETGLNVKTFQLQPGDVLIAGSDGRDDIVVGVDARGRRMINEDESQFLRLVEQSQAKLPAIEKALRGSGELTDDLSLLRIAYLENEMEERNAPLPDQLQQLRAEAERMLRAGAAENAIGLYQQTLALYPTDVHSLRRLARLHLAARNFGAAAQSTERLAELQPSNVNYLYATSLALKRSATNATELSRAADFGERCRLREPQNTRNLVNLADCYRLLGARDRAAVLLHRALDLEPDHGRAGKLRQLLEQPAGG